MFLEAIAPPQVEIVLEETPFIFDRFVADVTGDQIEDFIYLVGNKESPDSMYQENISIYVVDGLTNELHEQPLPLNGGYGASLFIGDFNRDYTSDVYVSINSGEDEDINYYYIYGFKDKEQIQLLEYQEINNLYQWEISFTNGYGVQIENLTLNQIYHLDISDLDEELLAKYYTKNAKINNDIHGEVIPLGGLTPIMALDGDQVYNLVASQPIIGLESSDKFGTIDVYLTYDEGEFIPYEIVIGNRISLK